ncbi:MAG: nucleotide-binding protein [Bryobacteraceae bacterium]|nr:nucleotide-binding protein [Bryobacteraceae bacterium]
MERPSIFVGSSTKGLEVAEAIQSQLCDDAEVVIWKEGVFGLGQGTLESLVKALDGFDFAILVLTPDDVLLRGDERRNSARDNVLLELGLFMGRLGRERTFIVCPKDMQIPSDLAGVTMATYVHPQRFGYEPALGKACYRIKSAIESYKKAAQLGQAQLVAQVDVERVAQSTAIVDYIATSQPHRINVLHMSGFGIIRELLDASWKCSDLTICLLLMHPDEATKKYGPEHGENIRLTETTVKRVPECVSKYGYEFPTVGLWYYRHEPGIAVLTIDNALVQLGWYLRAPNPRDPQSLCVQGHNQPSLLAKQDNLRQLLEKVGAHFKAVWREAVPASDECFVGPRAAELQSEWHRERDRRTVSSPARPT